MPTVPGGAKIEDLRHAAEQKAGELRSVEQKQGSRPHGIRGERLG
jgi:hypothetical protein